MLMSITGNESILSFLGIRGTTYMQIKTVPEDFIVEELPLYEPSGIGIHTFFSIRKKNVSTFEAIRRIAKAVGVNTRYIGYAGLKDKNAVTTQVLSLEGVSPAQILALELPAVEVLWAKPHPHKLRVGHLRGNRFKITLREMESCSRLFAQKVLPRLAEEGVPNRFGPQRFGQNNDSHLIGKALVQGEWETALSYLLADETMLLGEVGQRAQKAVEQRLLMKAIGCIPHRLRKLFLSAYQAYLFNSYLQQRIFALGQLIEGDIAIKHSNGAPFLVDNLEVEQARADTFEISPSGPIFGYKMKQPAGEGKAMEATLLTAENVEPDAFRKVTGIRLPGTRRPLRMPIEMHQVTSRHGEITSRFHTAGRRLRHGSFRSVKKVSHSSKG